MSSSPRTFDAVLQRELRRCEEDATQHRSPILQDVAARLHSSLEESSAAVVAEGETRGSVAAAVVVAASTILALIRELPCSSPSDAVPSAPSTVHCEPSNSTRGTILDTCVAQWLKWLRQVASLHLTLASRIAVRLPAVHLSWGYGSETDDESSTFFDVVESAMSEFFFTIVSRCRDEWKRYGVPLRTLQPPLSFLTSCARLQWALDRFGEQLAARHGTTGVVQAKSEDQAPSSDGLPWINADLVTRLSDLSTEMEALHIQKLTQEALLFSFETTDWRIGNAVPAVCNVAPLVWCLFQRCHSYALRSVGRGHDEMDNFFEQQASAHLVSGVLESTVNGVRLCIQKNAAHMHADRVEHLTTRDIPCLVLLVRLWWSWIASAMISSSDTAVLLRLEQSVVELIAAAWRLRHVRGGEAEVPAATKDSAAVAVECGTARQERAFLDVIWPVMPLSRDEIRSHKAAVPWSPSFVRAKEVQLVLGGQTVVAPVR